MTMLTNKNFKTDWKTGDTCFIHEAWTDSIRKAVIKKIKNTDSGKTVYIVENKDIGGVIDRYAEHLFSTRKEGIAAMNAVNAARQAAFEAEITDVESLVRFAYTHNIHSGGVYEDCEARAAYKKRAEELLGITFER